MVEQVFNGYQRLFEVRLLHHYWLDEGATVFDLIPDQIKKDRRLLKYDIRSYLGMRPRATTAKTIRSVNGVYKNTALGCMVAVPSNTVIRTDTIFEFVVTVKDASILNYTSLTLRPQKIYELYHQAEYTTYRYRENVPVFSNLTGASRGTGLNKSIFLSKEFPPLSAGDQVESLVLSGNALLQLTGDQPGAGTQELHSIATSLPVFVNQGDVPTIVPPPGLIGVPACGVLLSDDMTDNVFALIRLSAVRTNDSDFSCIDGNGHAKTPYPIFQIRFKNRSTVWQYFNKTTGVVNSEEPKPLPLTHFGNAGTKQKPSEGLVKAEKNGTKITKLVSEIFV